MKKTYLIIIVFLGVLFGGIFADSDNKSNQSLSEDDSRNKVWELLADADTVFIWGVDYSRTRFFPVKTYRIDDKHIEIYVEDPKLDKPVIFKNIEVPENADLRKFSAIKTEENNWYPAIIRFAFEGQTSQGFEYLGMGENSNLLVTFTSVFLDLRYLTLTHLMFAKETPNCRANFPYILWE